MNDASPSRSASDGRPGDEVGTAARGLRRRLTDPGWLARAAGVALAAASLGVVASLALAVASGGRLALVTRPPAMRVALALPPVVAVLALATAVGTALAWRNRYWSLAARVHQTVLAVLGLGFVWGLAALGFL